MHRIALAALISAAAQASTIYVTISGGTADVVWSGSSASAQFSLVGPDTMFTASGPSTAGPCSPALPCTAGNSFVHGVGDIRSGDLGLNGTLTYGGTTFNYSAPDGLGTYAELDVVFQLLIPSGTISPLTLTTNFIAFAMLWSPAFHSGDEMWMTGSGVATIQLSYNPSGGFYTLDNVHSAWNAVRAS